MKHFELLLLVALSFSIASAGCVEKSRRLSEEEQKEAKSLISDLAPRPTYLLEIKFEDKVRLLGYDVDQKIVRPGEPFRVTWYWKVEKKVGEGWLQFTHIADAKNVNRINVDAERAVRRLHPPEQWKPGEYIKDTQELTLPGNWNSPEIKLYLGFWNGPHRLHVVAGPNDGDNRGLGLTLPVKVPESANAFIRLPAIKTTAPVKVDGKLDEPEWGNAPATSALVDPLTGKEGAFGASVRAMYDQTNLYFAFDVADTYLKSSFQKADEHLWTQDAVEIMIDPDGDGKNYYEIQASPLGVVFDTRYDLPRRPAPFGYLEWSSLTTVKVTTRGKANDDQVDTGYLAEMSVPWKSFGVDGPPATAAGKPSSWRMNFFVMDARKDGQRAVSWSAPLVGDFHTLDRFGQVEFLNSGSVPPPGTPGAAAATSKEQKAATASTSPGSDKAPKTAEVEAKKPVGDKTAPASTKTPKP